MLALRVPQGGVFGLMSMFAYPGLGDANGWPKHTHFLTCTSLVLPFLAVHWAFEEQPRTVPLCVYVCVSVGVCVCVCVLCVVAQASPALLAAAAAVLSRATIE